MEGPPLILLQGSGAGAHVRGARRDKEEEEGGGGGREEMTSCLYECLGEVGLQRHYHRFAALGVRQAAQLSRLTMEDYPHLGVFSMEDRARLFRLVQLVKTLHEDEDGGDDEDDGGEEDDDDDGGGLRVEVSSSTRRTPTRRQLDFSGGPSHSQFRHSRAETDVRLRDIRPDGISQVIGSPTNHSSRTRQTARPLSNHKPSLKCTASTLNKGSRLTNQSVERQRGREEHGTPVRRPWLTRVCESPGYNYGLPLSSPVTHRKAAGEERIRVCVRKRPLTRAEDRRGEGDVVSVQDGGCVTVHEERQSVDLTQYILQHRFYYDQVFGEDSSNEQVYQSTAFPLVQHLLSGGKATCFAYGQTGAGKTHTMLGPSPGRPGLYALAARDIFRHLHSSSSSSSSSCLLVYVSFFEIYCGQLYDLLDRRKKLFAREDAQKKVQISGLRQVRVESVSSLLEAVGRGTGERTQGVSGVNSSSSRSHALLQIQLRDSAHNATGRMWFVDLAGSERAADSREPDRLSRMEGAEINQSLLALKECIRSLDQENSHTPFRQSKLTQVLRDSFVGDSKTCMIANISPSHLATEHTLNTLRYADRVKELKETGSGRGGRGGGKKGGGAGRTVGTPAPKRVQATSSSSSSGSFTQGPKTPLKRVRLGQGRGSGDPAGDPALRLPTGGAVLCSTPKRGGAGQLRGRAREEELVLEPISPVRGTVEQWRVGRERVGGERERRSGREERHRNRNAQHVSVVPEEGAGLSTRRRFGEEIDLMSTPRDRGASGGQSSGRERLGGVERTGAELRGERNESRRWVELEGVRRREEHAGGRREIHESGGWVTEAGSSAERERREESESERAMHLRRYHQQLQQFHPLSLPPPVSPPPLSVSALSVSALTVSSPLSVSSSLSASPTLSVSPPPSVSPSIRPPLRPPVSSGLQELLAVYGAGAGVRVETQGSVRAESMLGSVQEQAPYRSGQRWAWSDRDEGGVWPERRDQGEEGDILLEEEWTTEEEDEGDSFTMRSTGSNNSDNNSLHPQPALSHHLRAPAERPLSPANLTDAPPSPGKLNDLSLEYKLNNHPSNIQGQQYHNTSPGETTFDRIAGAPVALGLPRQPYQASLPLGSQPPEPRTHPGTRGQTSMPQSSGDSSLCSMEPLSLSLLQVEQLVATTSFLSLPTDTPWSLGTQAGERAGAETRKAADVEEEWRENEEGEVVFSMAELVGIKTMSQVSPSTHHSGNLEKSDTLTVPLIHTTTQPTHTSSVITTDTLQSTQDEQNASDWPRPARPSNLIGCPTQTLETLERVQWSVLQAHMDQLEEMEGLCVREEILLSQHPVMGFREYVEKLEEIMELKNQCVDKLRVQLKPYLLREREERETY